MNIILLLAVIFPILAGILAAVFKAFQNRIFCAWFSVFAAAVELVLVLACGTGGYSLELFRISDRLVFCLHTDKLSMLFSVLTAAMWLVSSVYAVKYMEHDRNNKKVRLYQASLLISLGITAALCFSANLITMYLFYELMTLATFPMVIHDRTKEAVKAGFKYLLYSMGGAFLGLAALFIFYSYGIDLNFHPTGNIGTDVLSGISDEGQSMLLTACMFGIIGFGSKAGMFPLHGWLPAAHPVAPAPASALLSGNITKMGVLFIIRIVYYIAGPEFLRGTWVQQTFLILTLITIFMGSVLASREKLLKRRLAYSTISQVSYCLFGIALLQPLALCGALLHIVFHSLSKNALFLLSGIFIHQTRHSRVDEMRGIGKQMPVCVWGYVFVSLTLIGIPPTSAFLSKWYLAQGALAGGLPVIRYLGPAILLVSAVFTAAYLLPLAMDGFFPGEGKEEVFEKKEPHILMLAPVLMLVCAAVLFGMFPGGLMDFLTGICSQVL